MAPPSVPGFSIIAQIGPMFIGTILNYLLTGILIHQLFDYNKNYPHDKWAVKWLVYGSCFLDMVQTGFTTQFSWYFCIQNWGEITAFTGGGFAWTASILPIMAGLVAMIVQLFYAWRIWTLGGRYLKGFSVAIGVVAFMEFLGALIGSIKYDIIKLVQSPPAVVPYFMVWLVGSFTCDVLIAGCMTIIFMTARTRSTFDKTNSIINILIRHVVETAAITAVCAGVGMVLFVKSRNQSLAHTVPAYVLGKLYTNCLLANLNNRRHLTSAPVSEVSDNGGNMNSFQLRKFATSFGKMGSRKPASDFVDLTSIRVDETRIVQRDGESVMGHAVDSKERDTEANYGKDDKSETTVDFKTFDL
ncbi:hypothetical protein SCHPADRAFT_938563 [Schizopora paradoxa]|uniref:DUF6534 domain-containing protein n=1 Tax=Schizopora paradoxa TaxID=27342 RepID=A0A0H2S1E6_9AGAM|nr:hypothetical protein SCHPADRAFT_938563 [Schizopora paradoxa]